MDPLPRFGDGRLAGRLEQPEDFLWTHRGHAVAGEVPHGRPTDPILVYLGTKADESSDKFIFLSLMTH